MKKILLLVAILLLTLLPSCILVKIKIPYGVWESSDPAIIAYISPDITEEDIVQGNTFRSTFTSKDGEIKNLSVLFNDNDGKMMIYEKIHWEEGGESYNIYFSGDFKVRKNTLTMYVVNQVLAGTDYKEIVFTKIQDYEEVTE